MSADDPLLCNHSPLVLHTHWIGALRCDWTHATSITMLLLLMLNVSRFPTLKIHLQQDFFWCEKPQHSYLNDATDGVFFFFFYGPWGARLCLQDAETFCYMKFVAFFCHSWKPDIFIQSLNWLICVYLNITECASNRGNRSCWVQFTTHQRRTFSDTVPFSFLRILITPHHLDCWFQPARFYSVVHNSQNDTGCSGPTAVYLIVDDSPLCKM